MSRVAESESDACSSRVERQRRPTIAVLTDHLDHLSGGFESELRAGYLNACKALGYNLLMVVGRALDHEEPQSARHNQVYELLDAESVDGLVILTSGLSQFRGPERVGRFCERYRPLPMCSLGYALPGVPSVIADNHAGMVRLVEHVVSRHRSRNIAFIQGMPHNPESQIRLQAVRQALASYGLELPEELIATGNFVEPDAASAMQELLDRGSKIDAVLAANDSMALGALRTLRQHGLRAPRDIIVTGFDDVLCGRDAEPPLTTARQPLEQMAEMAIHLVADQIAGKKVPDVSHAPVQLVPRASCGCEPAALLDVETVPPPVDEPAFTPKSQEPEVQKAPSMASLAPALEQETSGQHGVFLATVRSELAGATEREITELQAAVGALLKEQRHARDLAPLFTEARLLVRAARGRVQIQYIREVEAAYFNLLESGQDLSTALDLNSLHAALASTLPKMGIRNALISLYDQGERAELEPWFYLRDGEQRDPGSALQAPLLPPGRVGEGEPYTAFLLPLVSEKQNWGVAVLEFPAGRVIYEMLREQISAALQTADLHRQIVHRTQLHERSVQERLATAERMASLSMLAGGVAHDLNNTLGPLAALPDVILTDLRERGIGTQQDGAELRNDLLTIKAAALRASQTIKDLLTLGRQGRTTLEPLDLNRPVLACLSTERVRLEQDVQRNTRLVLNLHPEPLVTKGSDAQLARAITNLVRNAVEAVPNGGTVNVTTSRVQLKEPVSNYETIEPGDYVVVRVSDDGPGIAEADLSRIFEPFFSKKGLCDNSGTGLGLAIVHGVVKEHRGFLDVQSAVGRGTTFSLYFPVSTEALRRPSEAVSALRGSGTILVVDDEPMQLRAMRRVLSRFGYEVDTLPSGAAALELFRRAKAESSESPYDLLIIDVMLGEELDGLQVLERIAGLFPGQRGLVMSGHAPTALGAEAAEKGLTWLAKPVTSGSLWRAVNGALTTSLPRAS